MIDNTPSNVTLEDLVNFVLSNRRGKAFIDWTKNEVGVNLLDDYEKKQLGVYFDESTGEILGLAHGKANHETKRFHVSNLLVKKGSKNVIRGLLFIFDKQFPGYKLEGNRYGEIEYYDTPRFKRHLNSLT